MLITDLVLDLIISILRSTDYAINIATLPFGNSVELKEDQM